MNEKIEYYRDIAEADQTAKERLVSSLEDLFQLFSMKASQALDNQKLDSILDKDPMPDAREFSINCMAANYVSGLLSHFKKENK